MKKLVVLDSLEINILTETLEYIVIEDDKERVDFVNQALLRGFEPNKFFDEYDGLLVDKVPKELKSHIFFKASFLLDQLTGVTYGE